MQKVANMMVLLVGMRKNEQIQFFDSQAYLPVILIRLTWNFSATIVEYTGLGKNSRKILER